MASAAELSEDPVFETPAPYPARDYPGEDMQGSNKSSIQVAEERQLPAALNDLQQVLSSVEVNQQTLASRLYPVLEYDQADQTGGKAQSEPPMPTRVVDILGVYSARLQSVLRAQQDLIDRLHV
jgi:hypothetical protein